jgi:syntaxin-binding protein 1
MANDLLDVDDGVISYKTTNNKNQVDEKQALLNESDEFWMELRHNHIAKVIETIKERMNDIIQNNAGAALSKANGADLDITTMAAAVKKLPEYTQTMTKLGQHVAIAQQCMDAFSREGLMKLSQVEQTISTGFDEDGKETKGNKLCQLVCETLRAPMSKDQKIRLLCIYYIAQKAVAGNNEDYIRQAITAAKVPASEQVVLTNFDKILGPQQAAAVIAKAEKGGMFSSIFKKTEAHAATPEGEYADTRHTCQLKLFLEQFTSNELSLDRFPATGPSANASSKTEAKSVRKFGANSKFAKKDNVSYSGGRYMVFIAGGIAYSELRVGYELSASAGKEIVMGGSHLISPTSYIVDVQSLHVNSSAGNKKREDNL